MSKGFARSSPQSDRRHGGRGTRGRGSVKGLPEGTRRRSTLNRFRPPPRTIERRFEGRSPFGTSCDASRLIVRCSAAAAVAGCAWRGAGCSVTAGHHRPSRSGDGRLASAARTRQRPRAREAARRPTPRERTVPRLPPPKPSAWWCFPLQVTLPLSATSRPSALRPGSGPALACRRRALDERMVLVLANWSYAGTGYTPRTPGAELALVSADMARARQSDRRFTVNPALTPNEPTEGGCSWPLTSSSTVCRKRWPCSR
jgi:hypothetical protein